MAIDIDKLEEFLGRFVADLGATAAAGNVVIGHRLGLYKALAGPTAQSSTARSPGARPPPPGPDRGSRRSWSGARGGTSVRGEPAQRGGDLLGESGERRACLRAHCRSLRQVRWTSPPCLSHTSGPFLPL